MIHVAIVENDAVVDAIADAVTIAPVVLAGVSVFPQAVIRLNNLCLVELIVHIRWDYLEVRPKNVNGE
jgi:hypothetical protein